MRRIFLSLLVFNVLALVWGWLSDDSEAHAQLRATPFAYKHVDTLQLLAEVDRSALVSIPDAARAKGAAEVDARSAIPSKDGRLLCEMVGPFKDRQQALDFTERLVAMDVDAEVKEVELPAGSRYQIYLPPEDSHRAALRKLAELQAKKVDSYIIPKGELGNGISLGMFSKKNLAEQRMRDMRGIGLAPEMNVIERTYWELWAMLAPGEDGKMSKLTWSRVMEGINNLERRQNFCLDVASKDNFH